MLFKLVGAVFVVYGSGYAGYSLARRLKKRRDILNDLRTGIVRLKGMIRHERLPLFLALSEAGKGLNSEAYNFFVNTAEGLRKFDGTNISLAVFENAKRFLYELNDEELNDIKRLGDSLGMTDAKMQSEIIDNYIESTDRNIKRLEEEIRNKSSFYIKAGTMLGIFITIILI